MANARSTIARKPRKPLAQVPAETAAPTERDEETRQPAEKSPETAPVLPLESLRVLQRRAVTGGDEENKINVRLCIDGSDADGVRFFDELLPVSLVRALLDPMIANFFIPIRGDGRTKPPRARGHWLHTQYIREIVLLDTLPEEK